MINALLGRFVDDEDGDELALPVDGDLEDAIAEERRKASAASHDGSLRATALSGGGIGNSPILGSFSQGGL